MMRPGFRALISVKRDLCLMDAEGDRPLHSHSDSASGTEGHGVFWGGGGRQGGHNKVVHRGLIFRLDTHPAGMCCRAGMIGHLGSQKLSKIFEENSTLEVCDIR